jgi:hypothetical protein
MLPNRAPPTGLRGQPRGHQPRRAHGAGVPGTIAVVADISLGQGEAGTISVIGMTARPARIIDTRSTWAGRQRASSARPTIAALRCW